MEIFLRSHDKVSRVLWLNSLPARFKKEILSTLIEEKIELSVTHSYKVYVDFGSSELKARMLSDNPLTPKAVRKQRSRLSHNQTKNQSPNNAASRAQSPLLPSPGFETDENQDQHLLHNQNSMSPIRVMIHQLEKSESKVQESETNQTLSKADQLRQAQNIDYEEYLKHSIKPSEQRRMQKKRDGGIHIPNLLEKSSVSQRQALSRNSMTKEEKEHLKRLRESQMNRSRVEAQDSWKEFTQSVAVSQQNKHSLRYGEKDQTTMSLITGQALPVGKRNNSGLQTVANRPARLYEAVITTNTLDELHGSPGRQNALLTKSSLETSNIVNLRFSGIDGDDLVQQDVFEDDQTLQYSQMPQTQLAFTPTPELADRGTRQTSGQEIVLQYSGLNEDFTMVDYAVRQKKQLQQSQRTQAASIKETPWCLVPSVTVSNHVSELSGGKTQPVENKVGLRESIRSSIRSNKSRSLAQKQRKTANRTTDPTGLSGVEVSFNAETYATKKKLLQQMIEELANAKAKLAQQQDETRSPSAGARSRKNNKNPTSQKQQYDANSLFLSKKNQQRSSSKQETYRIRKVLIADGSSTTPAPQQQIRTSQIVTESAERYELDSPKVTIESQAHVQQRQFGLMMNTLNADSKQQTLSKFKELRRVAMPKPKTIQQYMSDTMRANAPQLKQTLQHFKQKQQQKQPSASKKGKKSKQVMNNSDIPQKISSLVNSPSGHTSDGQPTLNAINDENKLQCESTDTVRKIETQPDYEDSHQETLFEDKAAMKSAQDSPNKRDSIQGNLNDKQPPSFRPNSQAVKTNPRLPMRGGRGGAFQAAAGGHLDSGLSNRHAQDKNTLTTHQIQIRASIETQKLPRGDQMSTELLSNTTGVATTVQNQLAKRHVHNENSDGTQHGSRTRQSSIDFNGNDKKDLQQVRKSLVIPAATPRVSEPGTVGADGNVHSSHDVSLCGNVVLDSRLTEHNQEVTQQRDYEMSGADAGISAAESSLLMTHATKKQFSQTKSLVKQSQSPIAIKTKLQKMLTINYFGNIQDQMIGQIKTKIPISDKQTTIKTFNTPPKHNYPCHDEQVLVKPQTASNQNNNLVNRSTMQQPSGSILQPRMDFSKINSQIFYGYIGKEPYRINSYVRPKGLASFKLVSNPTEKEMDFAKRKEIYEQEKEIECQYENLRNQQAALRGSMIRDPNTALFVAEKEQQAVSGSFSRQGMRETATSFTMRQSASQPQIRVLPGGFNRTGYVPVQQKQGATLAEQGSRILLNKSRSRQELAPLPQQQQQNESREDEIRRAQSGISPYQRNVNYLQKEERAFLDEHKQAQIMSKDDSVRPPKIKTRPATQIVSSSFDQQQQKKYASPTTESLIAEFIKQEKANDSAHGSPFAREARYANDQINVDLTSAGMPKDNSRMQKDNPAIETQESEESTEMLFLHQGPAGEGYYRQSTNRPVASKVVHSSMAGAVAAGKEREAIYTSLSTIEEGGSLIQTNPTPKNMNIQLTNQQPPTMIIKSKSKTKKGTGRNTALSRSVKLGKMNVSLAAHSHAQQIKSFVNLQKPWPRTKQPTLLGHSNQTGDSLQKGTHERDSSGVSESDVTKAIGHLTKPSLSSIDEIAKASLAATNMAANRYIFGNAVNQVESRTIPQKMASTADQAQGDAGEIYLRFLRYKNTKTEPIQ